MTSNDKNLIAKGYRKMAINVVLPGQEVNLYGTIRTVKEVSQVCRGAKVISFVDGTDYTFGNAYKLWVKTV